LLGQESRTSPAGPRRPLDKLKAAIADIEDARSFGFYEGRHYFGGIAITLPLREDLIGLGAGLAKAGADTILRNSPHFDEMGKSLLVAWDINLFDDSLDQLQLEGDQENTAA
jgi:hypothetical protein